VALRGVEQALHVGGMTVREDEVGFVDDEQGEGGEGDGLYVYGGF
jgi:hypothetical protein